MADAAFRELTDHVDMFTPDDRTDRPALGAIHGARGTLLVEAAPRPPTCGPSWMSWSAAGARPPPPSCSRTGTGTTASARTPPGCR